MATSARAATVETPGSPWPEGHRSNPLASTPTGGRLLSASQLWLFLLLPPQGYGVLTVTGRRSGKRRRRCIRAVRVGNTAYLAAIGGSKAQWLRNMRANPSVGLRIRGGTFSGTARPLRADEVDTARRAYCETLHPFDWMTHVFHMRGRPTRARIQALLEHWFHNGDVVAIDLDGQEVS